MTTIDHNIAAWGYGSTSTATLAGRQHGLRRGRLYPAAPADATSTFASIRPYTTTWLATADSFGVSFPAGLVGVASIMQRDPASGGTFNDQYESEWTDLTSGATIIPVPGVLPSGYTANLDTPWVSYALSLRRLRTAAGFTDYGWGPTSNPNGSTTTKRADNLPGGDARISFDGVNNHIAMTITTSDIGFRKLRYRLRYTSPAVPGGFPVDAVTLRISHNNDTGTVPSGTNDGDTIDHTTTLAAGAMSYDGTTYTSSRTWPRPAY